MAQRSSKRKTGIFDDPKMVTLFLRLFYAACAFLVVADFFTPKHPHFPWEGWPGFFAAYGFICFVGMVFAATLLRNLIMRPEDYYDE